MKVRNGHCEGNTDEKPQLKRYSRLELIKDQYPTGAVGILREQAEELPLHQTQP